MTCERALLSSAISWKNEELLTATPGIITVIIFFPKLQEFSTILSFYRIKEQYSNFLNKNVRFEQKNGSNKYFIRGFVSWGFLRIMYAR